MEGEYRRVAYSSGEEEIDLLEYLAVIIKWRWMILSLVLFAVALTYIVSKWFVSPLYQARVSFMPNMDKASLSANVGNAMGQGGMSADYGKMARIYSKIVVSNDFLDNIIKGKYKTSFSPEPISFGQICLRRGLIKFDDLRFDKNSMFETLHNILKLNVKLKPNRDGSYTIFYSDPDPVLSAELANSFVRELKKYIETYFNRKAREKRLMIEKEIAEKERLLANAERAELEFMQRNRMIITPGAKMEKERLERNVNLYTKLCSTLREQLELAKIAENENKFDIIVFEKAVPPQSPFKPKLKLNLMISLVVSLFFGVFVSFLSEFIKKVLVSLPKDHIFVNALYDLKRDFRVLVGLPVKVFHIIRKHKRLIYATVSLIILFIIFAYVFDFFQFSIRAKG